MTRRDDLVRLRDQVQRIEQASNHYAIIETYSEGTLRYAHKSTRSLARETLEMFDALIAQEDAAPMTPVIQRGTHD